MNTDTIALLDKHFDLAVNAPDGIKRLREMILTLAMQGKLVPQDPKDQPASELLKDIEAEKKRLVKEGKIKEPKPLPPIKPEEVPYQLSKGWEWVKLDFLCNTITDGTHSTPTYVKEGVPFISVKNLSSGRLDFSDTKYIRKQEHQLLAKRCNPEKNDILYTKIGTTGIAVVIDTDIEFSIFVSVALLKFTSKQHYPKYFEIMLNSPLVKKYAIEGTEGVGNKNLVLRKICDYIVPLPPLAEQRRIVTKIDELMARVDELERKRGARNEKRLAMHQAAIARLLDAGDANASRVGRDFIFAHFGELYGTKENVAELRKAILQLAVMGRLVPQDPQDQPASELLKEIEAEKKRLVQEGKIKDPKPLPPIKAEEVPYQVPKGWEWVRLDFLCKTITDGTHSTPTYVKEGIPFVSVKNLSSGILDFTDTKYIRKEEHQLLAKRCNPERNDILYTKIGTTGIAVVIDTDIEFSIFVSVALLKFASKKYNPKYFELMLNSPLVKKYAIDGTEGVGNKNLVLRKICDYIVPLPPLAEQRRIVAKVDELMALCDKLDKQIDQRTAKESALLEAVAARV